MGNGNGGGGGTGAPGIGDADVGFGSSFGGVSANDSSYGGQGTAGVGAAPAGDNDSPGNYGGMGLNAGENDTGQSANESAANEAAEANANAWGGTSSVGFSGMSDSEAAEADAATGFGSVGTESSSPQDQSLELDIMQRVSQIFSVVNPFLGLALYGVTQMANEAQKGGQLGSNVSDAMGLGAEAGGLGGPGGGGQWDSKKPMQQVASPAPKVQRAENRNESTAARAQVRQDAAARRGRKSTLLTGGQGVLGRPLVDIKTLLGWR